MKRSASRTLTHSFKARSAHLALPCLASQDFEQRFAIRVQVGCSVELARLGCASKTNANHEAPNEPKSPHCASLARLMKEIHSNHAERATSKALLQACGSHSSRGPALPCEHSRTAACQGLRRLAPCLERGLERANTNTDRLGCNASECAAFIWPRHTFAECECLSSWPFACSQLRLAIFSEKRTEARELESGELVAFEFGWQSRLASACQACPADELALANGG